MAVTSLKGNCLCGAVEIDARQADTHLGACHCTTCRRWGGGPLIAVDCGTDVGFSDEASITRYPSSEWAERGFCANCGTHLFYHLKGRGKYIMPVGLFDDSADYRFDHQIFIEEKPGYYDFANDTQNMTGAEVFADAGMSEDN